MAASKALKAGAAGLPPHLRKPVFGALGLLAIVFGALLLWDGWQALRQGQIEPELAAQRANIAGAIGQRISAARDALAKRIADPYVVADLGGGAREDAAARVRKDWKELRAAEFHEPTLDTVFAGDLRKMGFARLALLSAAQTKGERVADLVGVGNDSGLGLAAPVRDNDSTVAIAYVELPLAAVIDPMTAAQLSAGYLELRSGDRVLASTGDPALKPQASSTTPVAETSMQLASALPQASGMLSFPPMVQLALGAVALLLGGGLAWQAARVPAAAAVLAAEPTFAAALKQEAPAPPPKRVEKPAAPQVSVDRSIFRAYDIRGVVGRTLDENVARLIGQAVGTLMREKGLKEIVVGRDGRTSGPSLSHALIDGLRKAGRDVIDIGLAPTPLVYFGTFHLSTGSGIAVTGSHNPADYNGFKIVVGGETLSDRAIQDLYVRIAENRLDGGGGGGLQQLNIADDYIARVSGDIQLERKIKIVVDAGNGVAGMLAPQTLEAIGAEVVPLFCEVDGTFPNHHPDPGEPKNLADLIKFVAQFGADLGVAFDGDGDRLGVVTSLGEIIYPDRLLALFAQDVLSRNPGATVIYDVKCTGHLAPQILRHGGSPIMWKTGHSLIKAKMKETDAELAGEMSGHFFFRERWFGFDDGIYAAARLLEILAADDRNPEDIMDEIPKGVSTPELKIAMEEGEHYAYMEKFREAAKFEGAKIATIDGVRADWQDGWGLVRCSNTTPSLVLRFDADSATALMRIQNAFRAQLLAVEPGLKLPF